MQINVGIRLAEVADERVIVDGARGGRNPDTKRPLQTMQSLVQLVGLQLDSFQNALGVVKKQLATFRQDKALFRAVD